MRIALLVVGLILTGIVGLQSMAILTAPLAPPVYREAAGIGVLMAIAIALGAGFALATPKISVGAFAVATVIGWGAAQSTPYRDLNVWAFLAMGLAALALVASRSKSRAQPAIAPGARAVRAAPTATPYTSTPAPASDAIATSLAGESSLIADLERLGRLHAANDLSDKEFANLKAQLISRAVN